MDATVPGPSLSRRQRLQLVAITAAAIGLYVFFRFLPTGTNLNHMDFRVQGGNSIEFCDPSNPQFIPVVAVRSPVVMSVKANTPAVAGKELHATVRLATASGKPMGPEDVLVVHTRPLHLLIADPTLTDYQHVHPEPTRTRGEWTFRFTPRRSGEYRVFADFTPTATGRGLYANADLTVAEPAPDVAEALAKELRAEELFGRVGESVDHAGYRFLLATSNETLRAGQSIALRFTVRSPTGERVPLEPVMDAYAHLVAFDEARSGFAHLHPMDADISKAPDSLAPTLHFTVTVPKAGRYVIWAQVALNGTEQFVPFWFEVA